MSWVIRGVSLMLMALVLTTGFSAPAHANSKYAAYVIHAESGDVFFDRYSTERRYPASLTKMMTLYLLFEELDAGRVTLDTKMKISERAAGQPPSKLGLTAGSTIDVKTAIEALVVKSANDVAAVVAEHISGSEWRFAQKMTDKARSIGMRSTTFRNASGLPNSKQVTTARDMATLGQRVMQDYPEYFPYFAIKSFTWNGRTYGSHNALVKTYDGADGIKTGYTRRSGFNLVTSAERDGQRLIGVVLGGRSSRTRDAHMREILDQAFAKIDAKPNLIAALHREPPEPRLKPTLVAMLAQQGAAPTVANNEAMRAEILLAANDLNGSSRDAEDPLGALIAASGSDDLNEQEQFRLAALRPTDGYIGEGDREALNEFSWGVQIGAYSTKELAQHELESAVSKLKIGEQSRAVIPADQPGGKPLYRARILKLTEIEAAATCSKLTDRGVSCFVVPNAEQ